MIEEKYQVHKKVGDKKTFDFWDTYNDEKVVLLDEYNCSRMPWDTLNALCDGRCELRIHGSVRISNIQTVFVCSNQRPEAIYPFMYHTLLARFNVIDLSLYMCPFPVDNNI